MYPVAVPVSTIIFIISTVDHCILSMYDYEYNLVLLIYSTITVSATTIFLKSLYFKLIYNQKHIQSQNF